jgi:hypothetical protein
MSGDAVRIFNPDAPGTPSLIFLNDARILDPRLPPNWIFDLKEQPGEFVLRPASWAEPGFWTRFFDGVEAGSAAESDGFVIDMSASANQPFGFFAEDEAARAAYRSELLIIMEAHGIVNGQVLRGDLSRWAGPADND